MVTKQGVVRNASNYMGMKLDMQREKISQKDKPKALNQYFCHPEQSEGVLIIMGNV